MLGAGTMKQARLTIKQWDELQSDGYTFTAKSYYWQCYEGNVANRITRAEFYGRSIGEPLQGVEFVRVYRRMNKNEKC